MTSFMHRGIFHLDNDTSGGMHCLRNICGFNKAFINEDREVAWFVVPRGEERKPIANQWFMSFHIYLNVVYAFAVVVIQFYVGQYISWQRPITI